MHRLFNTQLGLFLIAWLPAQGMSEARDLSGGATFISQKSSDSRIETDSTASVDIGASWAQERGTWWLYIEGNTTPNRNGVATMIPESNADAGTALDSDREGRLQISELNYQHVFTDDSRLILGLLDATAYIDTSRISNDENTQFLGVSFVNNPTIEFPDYALGLVYEFTIGTDLQVRMVLTSSNGLADNPNASYSQLVDIDNADKGVFAAARVGREFAASYWGSGVWVHTAPHSTFDGSDQDAKNYGVYAVLGWKWGTHRLNTRLGLANGKVSNAQGYAALAYQRRSDPWVLGAGVATILFSNYAPQQGRGDTFHSEVYLRYELEPGLFATASLQYLINSGFDTSDSQHDSEIFILGGRLSYLFD